jgi:hypothetical protein
MGSRPHTLTERELRFPPLDHTSYRWDCYSTPLQISSQGVTSGRPVTTLDCVLFKGINRAFVAGLGLEINLPASLWVQQRPRHIAKCWLSTQRLILLLIFRLDTPQDGSCPINVWVEPPLASLSVIAFPHNPECPGIQYSLKACQIEIAFNAFWYCCTKGDVVLAGWSAFRDAFLSQQMLAYLYPTRVSIS